MNEADRQRIIVVEDDEAMRAMMEMALTKAGYEAELHADGKAAVSAVALAAPALVVLDVGLPGMDGLDVLTEIRETSDVPVIIVTGRSGEADRIIGLDLGADDYMVKPIYPRELVARVRTVLRRGSPSRPEPIVFEGLTVDPGSREVTVGGEPVELTAKEFDLLAFLASAPRQVFTRAQLLRNVWDSSDEWQASATVTEHVRRVRRKIESDPDNPRWLLTVRGVGYRFQP
jgi:DNA-binding response OmpR family regulator